eukprot:symbB.v1.2.026014.t1/scaffold2529.1/size77954/2
MASFGPESGKGFKGKAWSSEADDMWTWREEVGKGKDWQALQAQSAMATLGPASAKGEAWSNPEVAGQWGYGKGWQTLQAEPPMTARDVSDAKGNSKGLQDCQAGSWMASFGPESGKGFKGKAWSSEADDMWTWREEVGKGKDWQALQAPSVAPAPSPAAAALRAPPQTLRTVYEEGADSQPTSLQPVPTPVPVALAPQPVCLGC